MAQLIGSFEVVPQQINKRKFWLICLLSTVVWFANTPVANADISWMAFSDINKINWSGTIDNEDPSRLYVKTHTEVGVSAPKKSSSYSRKKIRKL